MSFELVYSIIIPTLTVSALLYAAIQDILYREVRREFVWLLMVIFGVIFNTLYLLFVAGDQWTNILLEMLMTIVIGFVLGFVLFYIGFWGGADTKALWSLSILNPLAPFPNLLGSEIISLPFFSLVFESSVFAILVNSSLLTIFYPLVLVIINVIKAKNYSLFANVQASRWDKIRCFIFGTSISVEKINEKKLHFDFLEELHEKEFRGKFGGDFEGKLDGTLIGLFEGEINGEFQGQINGELLRDSSGMFDTVPEQEIFSATDELAQKFWNEERGFSVLDPSLTKEESSSPFFPPLSSSKGSDTTHSKIAGDIFHQGKVKGLFQGVLQGSFQGQLTGKFLGRLKGDFIGKSKKGKIEGSTNNIKDQWQITMRLGLEEEEVMDRRLQKTLWQLRAHNKKTVWITPGLPFVFFMLLGYGLYLLFGNLALLIFSL
ncbi:MAG: hypothetical protein GF308_19830 [Candidatus Heimdallarchaeota archaeon]|nr:hypothetical protein [Candidatus Heimdallarchaeota archaeon]